MLYANMGWVLHVDTYICILKPEQNCICFSWVLGYKHIPSFLLGQQDTRKKSVLFRNTCPVFIPSRFQIWNKHIPNSTLTVILIDFNWFSLYLRSHTLKYFHMSLNISVSMLYGALSLTCAAPSPRATPNDSMDLYMQK